MSKMPKGCDQQGRFPEAAEAATEVGQQEPKFYGKDFIREELKAVLLCGLGVVAVVGLIAFLVGVLV
jgi:hypothetical protein